MTRAGHNILVFFVRKKLDLIKALDASDNRQGLIKKAIRSYLETHADDEK